MPVYGCVCAWLYIFWCVGVTEWSDPGIVFSAIAELQRWLQQTCWLWMSGETGLSHNKTFCTVEGILIHIYRWAPITKVIFFSFTTQVCTHALACMCKCAHMHQTPQRNTMSVNKCLGWPSKPVDLMPFQRDSSLSEGNQLSNKTDIKEMGIYTRKWCGALNSASFPIALGRGIFVESWPQT